MTSMSRRALLWLLARVAAPEDREFLRDDLEEARARRAERAGEAAADAWQAREIVASLWPLARRRIESATRHRPHPTSEASMRGGIATDLAHDLRHALRLARRTPVLSAAVTVTIVLGIAVTTAIASVLDAVVIEPLPFARSADVVRLGTVLRNGEFAPSMAYPDVQDYRARATRIDAIAGVAEDEVTLASTAGSSDPERVRVVIADRDYALLFGLRAEVGRLFEPSEFEYDASDVVLLTDRFWRARFGGDRAIVGRTITLDDRPRLVVGVLAPTPFLYPDSRDEALVPLAPHPKSWMRNRGALWLGTVARAKPGVSFDVARAELEEIARQIAREHPDANGGLRLRVEPLHEAIVGPVRAMLELLAAAVIAVLLIACGNVANLLLGHAQTRTREFAVRAALGGSVGRLRRQLIAESLVLASAGGAVAIAVAPAITRTLIGIYPGALPRADEVHLNATVLVVALALVLVAGLLAAAPSAWRVGELDLQRDLRSGSRVAGRGWWSQALIVVQVAMSVALVAAATLLSQSFLRLSRTDPGFRAGGVLTFQLNATPARYPSDTAVRQFYGAALHVFAAIPGVRHAAASSHLPFGGGERRDVYDRIGTNDAPPREPMVVVSVVSPDYFRVMGIPVVRGRGIASTDEAGSPRVVVVDQTLAKRDYPGQDPIGRFVMWNGVRWEIVGIVGGIRSSSVADDPLPELYAPSAQLPLRTQYVELSTLLPPAQLLPEVRRELRRVDPTVALTDVATLDARLHDSLAPSRFRASLLGALGALALVLSLTGIYGVVAYAVSRQTREIGIRMALGESANHVRLRIVLAAIRLGALGAVVGLALALVGARWLGSFLSGVSPSDPRVLAASVGLAIAIVVAAAYVPARRASRTDPMLAIRAE